MYEIYAQFATRIDLGLYSEAIEHGIGKTPILLGDKDIEFLEQFPRKYWSQAMKKRYDMFFNYLLNLQKLRTAVYQKNYDEMEKKAEDFVRTHSKKGKKSLDPFVVNRHAKQQAQAMSKAAATRLLPAGREITNADFNKVAAGLPPAEVKKLRKIADQINNFYLTDNPFQFSDLKTGNEKGKNYMAKSFLGDLAKELEGEYGDKKGYDLHNPKIVRHEKGEPIYSTDGFQFPEEQNLQKQLNRHLMAIHNQIATATDEADVARMAGATEAEEKKIKDKQALMPVAKQIKKIFYNDALREMKQKKQANPNFHYTKDKIEKSAEQKTKAFLQKFTDKDQFKQYLMQHFGLKASDLKDINLPDLAAEIADSVGAGKVAQSTQKVKVPYKNVKVMEVDDEGNPINPEGVDAQIPAIPKSMVFSDIGNIFGTRLKPEAERQKDNPHDVFSDDILSPIGKPLGGIGKEYFDPILFEKIMKKWKAIKNDEITDPKILATVKEQLAKFGINEKSTIKDITAAAKRKFYTKSSPESYRQGSAVSSTYSIHPTRMTPAADFLNIAHKQGKYKNILGILMDPKKGITANPKMRSGPTLPDFINGIVDRATAPKSSGSTIESSILGRVAEKLKIFSQLRVLEHLNTPGLIINLNPDYKKTGTKRMLRGSPRVIESIINKEIKRYLDQDLLTGQARRKGDFLSVLDDDATKDLTCKQGTRRYQTGACVFGAQIMRIEDIMNKGAKQAMEAGAVPGDIVKERQQVTNILLGYKDMAQAIYVLDSAIFKAELINKKRAELVAAARTPEEKAKAAKQKITLTPEQETAAKDDARAAITQFFMDNITLPDEQFVEKIYNYYKTQDAKLMTLANKKDVANLKATKLGQMSDESGKVASLEDVKKKLFQRQHAGKQITSEMDNFDTLSVPELVAAYQKVLNSRPSQFDELANEMLAKIDNGAKREELQRALAPAREAARAQASKVVNSAYMDDFSDHFFYDLDNLDENPTQVNNRLLQMTQEITKFAPDKLLQHLVADLYDNYYWKPSIVDSDTPEETARKKKQIDLMKQNSKLRLQVRKLLSDEVKKRELHEDLITMLGDPAVSLKLIGQDAGGKQKKGNKK